MSSTSEVEQIGAEAKRIEESAMYASETQFEFAKTWRRVDRWLAAAAAALSGAAGVGALTEVFGITTAGLIAIAAAAVGAVAASINAPQTKEKAAGSASAYRALQQDARIFRNIELPRLTNDQAHEALQALSSRLQDLNQSAEIPSGRAWRTAKRQIEVGSQQYGVDD